VPEIGTRFDAAPLATMPRRRSDLAPLPAGDTWVNLRDLGAKGDGKTDDTEVLQKAITAHRAIYLPSGFYVVHDTLALRPGHGVDRTASGRNADNFAGRHACLSSIGGPKALLETPKAAATS